MLSYSKAKYHSLEVNNQNAAFKNFKSDFKLRFQININIIPK